MSDTIWPMAKGARLPEVAKKRHSGHVAGTSAPPPTGDIHWPMSVIVLISSALPPAPDVGGTPGECVKLTLSRHSVPTNILDELGQ